MPVFKKEKYRISLNGECYFIKVIFIKNKPVMVFSDSKQCINFRITFYSLLLFISSLTLNNIKTLLSDLNEIFLILGCLKTTFETGANEVNNKECYTKNVD